MRWFVFYSIPRTNNDGRTNGIESYDNEALAREEIADIVRDFPTAYWKLIRGELVDKDNVEIF